MAFQEFSDDGLAPPGAVYVRGIKKVCPTLFCCSEDLVPGFFFERPKIGSAQLPASESDLADDGSILAESSCVHKSDDDGLTSVMRKSVVGGS